MGTDSIANDLAPTGVLRASINLGNPVLAQGTPDEPTGVTVDLAREVGRRLGLEVEFSCFDAARKSFDALVTGKADLGFLAIEPARAAEVAFTAPYVLIEGVYVVPADADLETTADVDRPGVRVGVKEGSAYDLFLTRTLRHATVVREDDGVDAFEQHGLEVAAGIRQPMAAYVAEHPDLRLIDEPFMQIQQAVATTKEKSPETVRFLAAVVEELKANGFVAESLRRANQSATVAPAGRHMSTEIRPFAPEHANGVAVLAQAEGWPTFSDPDRVTRLLTAPGVIGLVAVQNETVVGAAQLLTDGHQSYLAILVVAAAVRGQGIGRQLVDAAFETSKAERMDLLTTPESEQFYRRFPHRDLTGIRLFPRDR